jgi:transposase
VQYDLDKLPDEVRPLFRELFESLSALKMENKKLKHELSLFKRMLFGRRSERFVPDPDQLNLDLCVPIEATGPEGPIEATLLGGTDGNQDGDRKAGRGRKKLPDHLERIVDKRELSEGERVCPCCGQVMTLLDFESKEQLDIRPVQFFVRRTLRAKYVCDGCHETLLTAPAPWAPIEKGLPGFALLAYVIVSKFADHLPLYRLQQMAARQGVALARSTMVGWLAAAADLLAPLVKFMIVEVLKSRKLHTDDTPVRLLAPGEGKTRTARFWPYVGDDEHPFVVFDFTLDRKRTGPVKFLQGFKGFLQVDAFAGYDEVFKSPDVIEVACNAHARRKLLEARETAPKAIDVAIDIYRDLYAIEAKARGARLGEEELLALRQEKSVPLLDKLHAWLREQQPKFLPKEPLGVAVGYALNNWKALRLYAGTGFLDIDNNISENAVRPVALGRKNWLFVGSPAGGWRASVFLSLLATCKRHGVNPMEYLTDVLERVWTHPASRIEELLPHVWKSRSTTSAPTATG